MCGIIAIAGKDPGRELSASLMALSHRGPDDQGSMQFKAATLGHTRLAIIDLSPTGHQPMRDSARNQAIVFNGEIYNYKELRAELEEHGHAFVTNSDTEAILKAYSQWGRECPKHLDGMFAFAIWDDEKQELFLARDRFGKKPLYYAEKDGTLYVASEIKALFAAGIKDEIDPAGIDAYLALMYVPPWRSVYQHIKVLEPACQALYKDGVLDIQKYWSLEIAPLSLSYDEAKNEVRRLLKAAVRKRLIADVEIGSFLSGGVDSTLVTAYAQEVHQGRLKTFALGYGDHINELPFAQQAADTIGTDHRTLQAEATLFESLEQTLAYFDEPHGDSADLAQHLLSERTAQHVKAALSGDGGDELFLGYGWYWRYWNTSKLERLHAALFSNPFSEYLRFVTVFNEEERRALFKNAGAVGAERADKLVAHLPGNGIQKINLFDLTTSLPGQLLTKVDQMSMMHGLEVRSPLLDYQLAEFAFNLPEEYKTDRRTGKLILKDLLAEVMPREFVDRKKQGFGAPVQKWLSEPRTQGYVRGKLGKDARVHQYLRPEATHALIEETFAGRKPKGYYQVWVLLCLELWLRTR